VWDDAKGRRFYLDGAHNPHAIAATCDWLQSLTSQPIDIVFGLSGKREALPLLKSLAPLVGRLIVTECISAPAIPAHEIAELARGLGILTEVSATPAQALATVSSAAVVGSLYLVGDVLAALGIQVEDLSIYAEA
jgi:folylpolyglutamate synthase/dihydropteroate synthase